MYLIMNLGLKEDPSFTVSKIPKFLENLPYNQ